jgi:formate dehydrogenase beta subunit
MPLIRRYARVKPTDVRDPNYFHKVVDCQWACPAHTNVPEYIRLIAQGRYSDAYMVNRESNVFPGILGRTCDRPCEPACRRTRVDEKPVAICRLKRVAADLKDDVSDRLPRVPETKNGKKIACIGAGPASLTVANDLMPLGYHVVMFEKLARAGGLMHSNIPAFRLPTSVLDEEIKAILDMGVEIRYSTPVSSMKALLESGYDAVFVGTGAPKGKNLDIPGREEARANIHIGIEWLESVAFGHIDKIGERVLIIGVGNTAMDCCRTSRRLGGKDIKVMARRPRKFFKASEWELEDAEEEKVEIVINHAPKAFVLENGKLTGMVFEKLEWHEDARGRMESKVVDTVTFPCDDVVLAIGQENAFPWIERDIGIEFDKWDMPKVDPITMASTHPKVFFGGDSAFGPKNIIWAVAHGHDAALSIDKLCSGLDINDRPLPMVEIVSQKMGIHEWSYDNDIAPDRRYRVPLRDKVVALRDIKAEVELGYDLNLALKEAHRCLNCDVQTVFTSSLCIECDACVDICPMDCITFTANGDEADLRTRLRAPAKDVTQDLYVANDLKTGRVMVKDEDVCLHCGLCAERCPTGAWDMKKYLIDMTHADDQCRVAARSAA